MFSLAIYWQFTDCPSSHFLAHTGLSGVCLFGCCVLSSGLCHIPHIQVSHNVTFLIYRYTTVAKKKFKDTLCRYRQIHTSQSTVVDRPAQLIFNLDFYWLSLLITSTEDIAGQSATSIIEIHLNLRHRRPRPAIADFPPPRQKSSVIRNTSGFELNLKITLGYSNVLVIPCQTLLNIVF